MFEYLLSAVALILGIVALNKISTLDRKVSRLKMQLQLLSQTEPQVQVKSAVITEVAAPANSITPKPGMSAPAVEVPASTAPEEPRRKPQRSVEQNLASRWFVWIGGIAIAIGGLLFVKYAFDHNLLSPSFQIFLALALAAALVLGGNRLQAKEPSGGASYVPAALSASGLAIAFGAVFAAYALYDLIAPGLAFLVLGGLGVAALMLSLRQGPFIAALGLAGSYATPTLVQTASPNAWTFFPYLLVIFAASFALLRQRPWWWLGYAVIAGSAIWAGLWLHGPFVMADVSPLGLFALAFGAISFFGIAGKNAFDARQGSLLHPTGMSHPLQLGVAGVGVASVVLALLVFKTHHATVALVYFGIAMAAICASSWARKGEVSGMLAAAVFSLLVLLGWSRFSDVGNPFYNPASAQLFINDTSNASRFFITMMFAGCAFTALGLAGVMRKQPGLPWSLLAASAPVTFVGGAWTRAGGLHSEMSWALIAGSAAAILLAVVVARKHKVETAADNLSSGLLAGGSATLLVFAAHRLFEGVPLSLLIAVMAFAYAMLTRIVPVRLLGSIAAALATLTALRLFAAREFWNNAQNLPLGQHWPIYGYGIPIFLFWLAARQLRSFSNTRSATALEGISLGLGISLISLELRVLVGGGAAVDHMTLLEMSSHILAWMGAAYGLIYRQHIYSTFVSVWGSRILLGASCAALILVSLILLNPLLSGEPLQGGVLFNALWLAYLAPALLLVLVTRKMQFAGKWPTRSLFNILSLILILTFVTLQTKRLFQGPVLDASFSGDAESYALSAVWLVLAIALLVAGLKLGRPTVRYAGLAVMILALLKTFGYDLWQLGGLWQIASVMGIGLSLVGVGWLYTRVVKTAVV